MIIHSKFYVECCRQRQCFPGLRYFTNLLVIFQDLAACSHTENCSQPLYFCHILINTLRTWMTIQKTCYVNFSTPGPSVQAALPRRLAAAVGLSTVLLGIRAVSGCRSYHVTFPNVSNSMICKERHFWYPNQTY